MDPAGSGIGKAAGELMKEMQKAQAEVQKLEAKQPGGGGQGFQNTLQNVQSNQGIQNTKQVQATQKAANILAQAKINANQPSARVGQAAQAERSRMANMLDELIGGQDKMGKIMDMALSGRQFSPPELLAMQAGVYKFSQELELTSKVVEKATGGIKQTMNTQV